MDTSEIEVFLTLVEELHFSRTAARLRLPQPQVSRLIARLERRIGGKLFERTSRKVTLTPLGVQLAEQATPAWAEMQAALDAARASARAVVGSLRIGCTITVGGLALSRLVEEFTAQNPDCEVVLHQLETWEPYSALRRGEVDVVVNWLVVDEPDMAAGPVIEYRDRVLMVGRAHRLAGREVVSAEDLGDEETEELPASYPAVLGDAIIPRFTPTGRPIHRTHPSNSAEDVIGLTARGRIVHPTMAGIPLFQRDDIALIPISDLPPMPLGLIWCTSHENARIRALAQTARQLCPASARQPAARPPTASAATRLARPPRPRRRRSGAVEYVGHR